jgi:hypothetical protein
VQIIPRLNPALELQQRQYRLYIMLNGIALPRATPLPIADDPLPANALVFEAPLNPGVNWIQLIAVAALPKGQRLPNGADCEVEKFTVMARLMRQ